MRFPEFHNYLAGFMEDRSGELMSLVLEEWNMEDALKYNREETWERVWNRSGREEGMKKVNITEEALEIIRKKDM